MSREVIVQTKIRLETTKLGWRMFRNNVGVLMDARGVPVRFGLANDSKVVNQRIKSADLIGIRPVVITQEMVGQTIGQFCSIECKADNWKYNANDEHQAAQQRWADIINTLGGYAIITNGAIK